MTIIKEGSQTPMEIGEKDGLIVVEFQSPVKWVSFHPEVAGQIAEDLAKRAYRMRFGIEKNGNSAIVEQLRQRLVTRTAHMIRSMSEQNTKHGIIAMHVVDSILAEVI